LNVFVLGLALSTPCIIGSQLSERSPAGIGFIGCTRALALVEIRAATGAQTVTLIAAHAGHRDGKFDLLAHYIVQIQAIIPVKRYQQIILGQLSFFIWPQSINRGNIEEIKALVNAHGHRRKTSGAIKLNGCDNPAGQPELVSRASGAGVQRRSVDNVAGPPFELGLVLLKDLVNIEPLILANLANVNLHQMKTFQKISQDHSLCIRGAHI
jgi:hypothetical protein